MSKPDTASAPKKPFLTRDRIVKLGFLVVAGLMVVWIYTRQTSGVELSGWGEDFRSALAQSRLSGRSVVALFVRRPPSETTRWMTSNTLAKKGNIDALKEGGYLRVLVEVEDPAENVWARRFRVADYPTLLLIGPGGWVYNRRAGRVGEIDFRQGFLDAGKVETPELTGWGSDLDEVISDAEADKRFVLVFLTAPEPGPAAQELIAEVLGDRLVRKRIEQGRFDLAHVQVEDLDSAPASNYRIRELPALVLALPDGRMIRKLEGDISVRELQGRFLVIPEALRPKPD